MVLFESFFIVYTIRGDKDPAWNCFPAKQTNASPKNTRGRGMGGRVPLRGPSAGTMSRQNRDDVPIRGPSVGTMKYRALTGSIWLCSANHLAEPADGCLMQPLLVAACPMRFASGVLREGRLYNIFHQNAASFGASWRRNSPWRLEAAWASLPPMGCI